MAEHSALVQGLINANAIYIEQGRIYAKGRAYNWVIDNFRTKPAAEDNVCIIQTPSFIANAGQEIYEQLQLKASLGKQPTINGNRFN
jgi:hypothetical protein